MPSLWQRGEACRTRGVISHFRPRQVAQQAAALLVCDRQMLEDLERVVISCLAAGQLSVVIRVVFFWDLVLGRWAEVVAL